MTARTVPAGSIPGRAQRPPRIGRARISQVKRTEDNMPHTNQHMDTRFLKAAYRAECHKWRDDVRFVEQRDSNGHVVTNDKGQPKMERRTYKRSSGRLENAPSFKQWAREQGLGRQWIRRKAA